MANEYLILDYNTRAYERMRRNFASRANCGIFLYFNKGPDPRKVANLAAIKIDEAWMSDCYPFSEQHIRSNGHISVIPARSAQV